MKLRIAYDEYELLKETGSAVVFRTVVPPLPQKATAKQRETALEASPAATGDREQVRGFEFHVSASGLSWNGCAGAWCWWASLERIDPE